MALPVSIDVSRTRGDTYPEEFTIGMSLAGATVVLTVDPSSDPTTSAANLFQVTGTVTDAAGGVVEFPLTTEQADQTPGTYYYDVQVTSAGGAIRTAAKGKWKVVQDITK